MSKIEIPDDMLKAVWAIFPSDYEIGLEDDGAMRSFIENISLILLRYQPPEELDQPPMKSAS